MPKIHNSYHYYDPITANDNACHVRQEWIGLTIQSISILPVGAPANERVWVL